MNTLRALVGLFQKQGKLTDQQKATLDCWLNESNQRANEVVARMRAQQALVVLNMTVTATILGVVFSPAGQEYPQITLAIPLVSCLLGWWFRDHQVAINDNITYVREFVHPAVAKLTGCAGVLRWYAEWGKMISWSRATGFALVIAAVFCVPSAIALSISSTSVFKPQAQLYIEGLWWLALVLTVLFFLHWIVTVAQIWLEMQGSRKD